MIRHNGNYYDPKRLAETIANRAKLTNKTIEEALEIWWRDLKDHKGLKKELEGLK